MCGGEEEKKCIYHYQSIVVAIHMMRVVGYNCYACIAKTGGPRLKERGRGRGKNTFVALDDTCVRLLFVCLLVRGYIRIGFAYIHCHIGNALAGWYG